MEELINDLEKKQSEYTDIDEIEGFTNEQKDYFTKGWDFAFDLAIQIVKENSYLFKE